MTDIETISICDVDYTDRPSEHEDLNQKKILLEKLKEAC